MKHTIDIVMCPEMIEAYSERPKLCVVIDIFRASTTMITALANGAKEIFPLADTEEAMVRAGQGHLVGAERNVARCDFAALGNDPLEYTPDKVSGASIYFTTTNGTRTIHRCIERGHEVIIGGFINIDAVAHYCRGREVLCVCAGWQGKYCIEDSIYGGALADRLAGSHTPASDAARVMSEIWAIHRHDLSEYLRHSDHFPRMERAGKAEAMEYCLTENVTDAIPHASLCSDGRIALSTR